MKGNCDIVKCQICEQEMSFGRVKRHIKTQHKNVNMDQYIKKYWSTLPLHQPCEVCNTIIVYKYKTCSPECRSNLIHKHKGQPKPKDFMSQEHKNKISKSSIGRYGNFTGHTHSDKTKKIQSDTIKNIKPHLGFFHTDETKKIQSDKRKEWYRQGNEPWTKVHSHSPETIKKIFEKKPMNKLEKFIADILDENNIKYHFQFFLKNKEDICKSYDFKIKDTNILIEIDGDYWHGGPSLKKHFYKLDEVKQNDLFKNQLAKDNNFLLLRFWESDIYNQPNIVVDKIIENI